MTVFSLSESKDTLAILVHAIVRSVFGESEVVVVIFLASSQHLNSNQGYFFNTKPPKR
jgi:hypothetical protein